MSDLIGQLENATGPDRELDIAIAACVGWMPREQDKRGPFETCTAPAYTASMDAAMTLVPVYTDEDGEHPYDYIIEHTNGGLTIAARVGQQSDPSFGDTVFLALCIAALKARITEPK